mgnify:CR=1 FL=1
MESNLHEASSSPGHSTPDLALRERCSIRFSGEPCLFLKQATESAFRRKDHLNLFPELSTATASRDLAESVESHVLVLNGTKRNATYRRL